MILDRIASIWRKVPISNGSYEDTLIYNNIRCAIIPISDFDVHIPYAHQSSHIVWLPRWMLIIKEDQIRYGRSLPGPTDGSLPWIYVVNGRQDFRMGVPQLAYYCKELD